MADSDYVQVNLVVRSSSVAVPGFKKPLVVSHNAPFNGTRTYNIASSIASVLEDFAADSPEAIAATLIASQSPHPAEIAIGRADGAVRQKYRIDVSSVVLGETYGIDVEGEGVDESEIRYKTLADLTFVDGDVNTGADTIAEVAHGMETGAGPFRLSNVGGALPTGAGIAADTNVWIIAATADTYQLADTKAHALANTPINITAASGGGTHTLRRNQNDVICAQLVQGLNAVAGKNFTAVQQAGSGETDYIEVTADADGGWFALSVNKVTLLGIAQTHADADVDEALAAILDVDKSWYWIVTLYNSKAYVQTVATWAEANGRAYLPELVESKAITASYDAETSDDAIAQITALGFKATMPQYHGKPAEMLGAGLTGVVAALPIGTWTAALKAVVGATPTAFSTTQRKNLTDRRGNGYEVAFSRPVTFDGMVGNADFGFLDNKVGLDALVADLKAALFGVKVGTNKIAATPEDIVKLESAALGVLKRYSSPERPVLKRDENLKVFTPTLADFNAATRTLSNFRVQGALSNAVQHTVVDLTVTN